ncbi:MAG: anhydro-N-acetylmuramic acid kinase [Flavobacteriales bacterium]|nr:anhydro-N-acetylmuramic acid kinase [Flavobacteriales bacterium]
MNEAIHKRCLGLMSGTSLDGLDIIDCTITKDSAYRFSILNAKTYAYPESLRGSLKRSDQMSAQELIALDRSFGNHIAETMLLFCKEFDIEASQIDFAASHGHTVFHQPSNGFTLQIGSGANIAVRSGITTISDFRSSDVALGGQGAPLVPIGDELLFNEYDYCLNLGGFANISSKQSESRVAFDICPLNIPLNYFANKKGLPFDDGGQIAKSGTIHQSLLKKLDGLEFYKIHGSKSLGKEWLDETFWPLLSEYALTEEDFMATLIEHFTNQIARVVDDSNSSMLITGGGAYNRYLIDNLDDKTSLELVLPEPNIIEFKEALIFALLGFLRLEKSVNTLASVTGARVDSIGGAIYHN